MNPSQSSISIEGNEYSIRDIKDAIDIKNRFNNQKKDSSHTYRDMIMVTSEEAIYRKNDYVFPNMQNVDQKKSLDFREFDEFSNNVIMRKESNINSIST